MTKVKIKKGDNVLVIAGRDRGERGKVLRVLPRDERAIVEGVNKIKRHTRPNPQKQIQGGVLEREAPTPMLRTTLWIRGTAIGLFRPNSSTSRGRTSSKYRALRRGTLLLLLPLSLISSST